MRNLTLFILLLSSLGAVGQQHWNPSRAWPAFGVVMDSVEQHYDFKQGIYHLDRSPEGWGVQILDNDQTPICRIRIWSPGSGWEFQPWYLNGFEDHCLHCNQEALYEASFNLYPYWGYQGWDLDVIWLLRAQPVLPDSAWYSLARAYSNYAQGLIRPQWGLHVQNNDSPARYEAIDGMRLQRYISYQDSCIQAFRKVEALNPRFETIIGPIGVKISNEHVHTALTLESLKAPGLASSWYRDDLYPTLLISNARNYLDACPEDAILFTNGDNDTYPLLYVQMKYNLRQDVTVVNRSLLYTGWYIDMLRDNLVQGRTALQFSVPAAIWYDEASSYLFVDLEDESAFEEIPAQLAKLKPEGLPGQKYLSPGIIMRRGPGQEFRWTLDQPHLLRNELAMLDIMASNPFRPICFSQGSTLDRLEFLMGNLRFEGMIFNLIGSPGGREFPGYGQVDAAVLEEKLSMHFDAAGYRDGASSAALDGITFSARTAFALLAWSKAMEGNDHAVDSLALRYRIIFAEEPGDCDDVLIWAMAWYELGERDRAGALLRRLGELVAMEYQKVLNGGMKPAGGRMEERLVLLEQAALLAEQEEDFALAAHLRQKRSQMP